MALTQAQIDAIQTLVVSARNDLKDLMDKTTQLRDIACIAAKSDIAFAPAVAGADQILADLLAVKIAAMDVVQTIPGFPSETMFGGK